MTRTCTLLAAVGLVLLGSSVRADDKSAKSVKGSTGVILMETQAPAEKPAMLPPAKPAPPTSTAVVAAPVAPAVCAASICETRCESRCRRLWEWLTYRPLTRTGLCGCCKPPAPCCDPPLYAFFLDNCPRCGATACDRATGVCRRCGHCHKHAVKCDHATAKNCCPTSVEVHVESPSH